MSQFSCTRGQFEEMCVDILARVEPPLQSLLEQASEYSGCGLLHFSCPALLFFYPSLED